MALLRLAVPLVLAFAVAGCGGGGESEKVREDLRQILDDAESADAGAMCRAITPESRRMMDVLGRGLDGAGGGCEESMEGALADAAGLTAADLEKIEEADVDVEGDRARVKAPDDRRIPMRKAGDRWVLDFAELPEQRYSLPASATCTELNLRGLRAPLPAPTRAGIAGEATRNATSFDRFARTLERLDPPDRGDDDEHERFVDGMQANARDWRRAASELRGVGTPLAAYNAALVAAGRRSEQLRDEQRALGILCLGMAATMRDAREYGRSAERICGTAVRRIRRLNPRRLTPALARRAARIGRRAAAALARLDPPETLAPLHRRSTAALADSYAALPRLAGARDSARAEERYGLLALRRAAGFVRMGLASCAQL